MNYDRSDLAGTEKGENGAGFGQVGGNRPQKSGRDRRWFFFAVDAFLLIIIAAVVLSLVSLFTPYSLFGSNKPETRTVTWVVEVDDVSEALAAGLTAGSTVTDYETGDVLGTVTAVEVRPYTTYTQTTTDGQHVAVVEHETKTVTLTLSVRADYVAGEGYTVSDHRIAAGRTYRLSLAGFVSDALCVKVR